MSEHVHDISAVEIVSRTEQYGIEVKGECPRCGATLSGCVELEVRDQ